MRLARARLHPFRLRLRRPLETARGAVETREGWAIELVEAGGSRGFGEAAPLPGFGCEPLGACGDALRRGAALLLRTGAAELASALDLVDRALPETPCARAALDVALHDLAGRAAGCSVAALLAAERGAGPHRCVPLSALLDGATPDRIERTAAAARDGGFPVAKLKIGAPDAERDVERVAAARSALGGGVALRLDANGAWKEADAIARLRRLEPFGVALVEQPVPARDLDALARVRRGVPMPVAADEAVGSEEQAMRILERDAADALELKPARLGGLRAAARIAARARERGVDVVVTSFLDSALGVTGALQLAAALPDALPAGLATSDWLAEDLAPGPLVARGAMRLPDGPGLGIAPQSDALRRAAAGPPLEHAP